MTSTFYGERWPNGAVRAACPHRFILAESPVWCSRTQRLLFVDIRAPAVHRLDIATGGLETWPMPALIGGVVLSDSDDRVIVALVSGLYVLRLDTGDLTLLLEVPEAIPGNRLNEMKCDGAGAIWFGTMADFGRVVSGALYHIAPDLTATRLRAGIRIPNGIAFSPDSATAYFADTGVGVIEAACVDRGTGLPGPWRTIVRHDAAPGRPDGTAVDATGQLWSARVDGGCVARFAATGEPLDHIALPTSRPTACAFGGAALQTLFVTTTRQGLTTADPWAGAVLAVETGCRGAEPHRFSLSGGQF